jgi:hypothetical protein
VALKFTVLLAKGTLVDVNVLIDVIIEESFHHLVSFVFRWGKEESAI